MKKRYYNSLLKQIKQYRPKYYLLYCISIITTYLFTITVAINLTNSAYNNFLFNGSGKLCFSCNGIRDILINCILYLMLFNVIFYTINEIRFRVLRIKKIRNIASLELGNLVTFSITIILFLLLIFLII